MYWQGQTRLGREATWDVARALFSTSTCAISTPTLLLTHRFEKRSISNLIVMNTLLIYFKNTLNVSATFEVRHRKENAHKNHKMLVRHQAEAFAASINFGVDFFSTLWVESIVGLDMGLVEVEIVALATSQVAPLPGRVWLDNFSFSSLFFISH